MSDKEKKDGFVKKASQVGKKMVDGIQKGAKNLSEQAKKTRQESKIKRLNPLFPEMFRSKDFYLPNVIEIVDDAVRRGVEECEGSIGWTDKVNDVEVLHLYDEYVQESGLRFVPFARCDCVYCVDPFERGTFINADGIFERTLNEKLAELEQVAYCLGAKSCSIEIVESDSDKQSIKGDGKALRFAKGDFEAAFNNERQQRGKNTTYFEGKSIVQAPKLKWFSCDDNITGLVKMCTSGQNNIKSKILELHCSITASMSQKVAVAVDKIKDVKLNASMSASKKAVKEHNSKLLFEVEF